MAADDKTAEKADQVQSGVEGALGQATDADQTHSGSDQTKGAPEPAERRDANAPDGTQAQRDAANFGGD
jgi:hypothetical protein